MTDFNISRRNFNLGLSTTAIAGALPSFLRAGDDIPSLANVARNKGLVIGSAYNNNRNNEYVDLILKHCDILTPENSLKPAHVAPTPTSRNFSTADSIYEFCQQNGKGFHGHTLFWYQRALGWADVDDFDEAKRLYGGYIRDVVSRYPDAVSWDVFNEILDDRRRFRDTHLVSKFGIDFIEFCLRETRAAAPDAKLVINDYNFYCAQNRCLNRQNNMIKLIKELQRRGAPLDVVGIQAHLYSEWPPSPRQTLKFIRRVEALGLDVYISEMDVRDSRFAKAVERRDEQVAAYYYSYLSAVLKSEAVKRVAFWGISDANNWIARGDLSGSVAGFAARPALFDRKNQPKPAYHAVLKALEEAPTRVHLLSVQEAQTILAAQGFDPGKPDGIWGRKSLAALNGLRASRGLEPAQDLDLESQHLLLSLGG